MLVPCRYKFKMEPKLDLNHHIFWREDKTIIMLIKCLSCRNTIHIRFTYWYLFYYYNRPIISRDAYIIMTFLSYSLNLHLILHQCLPSTLFWLVYLDEIVTRVPLISTLFGIFHKFTQTSIYVIQTADMEITLYEHSLRD